MLDISKSNMCNGCQSCYSVCPSKAISMIANPDGFLYPVINSKLCTECGLCEKICPLINPVLGTNTKEKAYAGYSLCEDIKINSSSGGVFYIFSEHIIKQKGVVFGAKYNDDFTVSHSWTENIEEIKLFQGSKYLQSMIGNSFIECKKYLEQNRMVLFSGTPCQIGGLISYLGEKPDNLFCLDFICHGVPSPLVWKKYIEVKEKENGSKLVNVTFRDKTLGWNKYSIKFIFQNAIYTRPFFKDTYMKLFLKDLILRESCYECKYKKISHVSDITIADFWGVENVFPNIVNENGVSLIITHTVAGEKLLNSFTNIFLSLCSLDKAIQYNKSMIYSAERTRRRDKVFSDFHNMDIKNFFNKYAQEKYGNSIIVLMKKIIKKSIRFFIK